jgi:serine/threonine protein kinase
MHYDIDRRLAQVLIQAKAVSLQDLHACRAVQDEARAHGRTPPDLSAILLERGLVEAETLRALRRAANIPHAPVEVPAPQPATGRRRPWRSIGGYELIAPIASGGSSTVFKARDPATGRIVAVKVLSQEGASDRGTERFLREAHVACQLRHENLVEGITVGADSGLYYFVMEYLEGESVGDRLRRCGRYSEHDAIQVGRGVARALECARQHGIVHRDIKPDNIMIDTAGRIKLCDLGLARPFGRPTSVTTTGIAVGTPRYISPEQARGDPSVDHRSDIYSLGITLYHIVVGEAPFQGESGIVLLSKHIYEDVPLVRLRRADLSPELEYVIARATRKDPDDRYETAGDMLRDLDPLVARAAAAKPAASGRLEPAARR